MNIDTNKYLHFFSLFFILWSVYSFSSAQSYTKYRIEFSDKNNSVYSINEPEEFLSQRAVQRRIKQNIAFTKTDIPVNKSYTDSLTALGTKIVNISKWFNSVIIQTDDTVLIDTICNINFIDTFTVVKPGMQKKSSRRKFISDYCKDQEIQYGYNDQLIMLNGHLLHEAGFSGESMQIAVIDAGFTNADNLAAFDSLWQNDQILGFRDFVNPENPVFNAHSHGMVVLSILGGNIPDELTGSAPKAKYWLLRSEDTDSEYRVEEDNWISAAEFADSAGVDIINTSLGYSVFDDTLQNYTYQDMDGKTTRISKGVNMAVSKGMLIVVSAGNERDNSWKYITAPADADSILSVGAVDINRNLAPFSSVGPAYDGRIKPDVVAQGIGTTAQGLNGLTDCNGTSCAAPVITGLTACLWQAFNEKNNIEIIEMVKESSSQYQDPDTLTGYGLPDFSRALMKISEKLPYPKTQIKKLYPNPFYDQINIKIIKLDTEDVFLYLYNMEGKLIKHEKYINIPFGEADLKIKGLSKFAHGIYILKIVTDEAIYVNKLIK